MRGYFITGTDTDVGKTTIALGLMAAFQRQGLRVAAMKPVSAGCDSTSHGLRNDDAVRLMSQASVRLPYTLVNPYAFKPPIAPHIAATQTGITMHIQPLLDAYSQIANEADIIIVEGAGGWLVPLNETQTMADLAVALDLPVINIVGLRLGCLNHALLTTNSIEAHGLTQAAWISNQLSPDMDSAHDNVDTLKGRLTAPRLGNIPYLTLPTTDQVQKHLKIELLL